MGIDADEGIIETTAEWLEDALEAYHGFITSNVGGVMFTDETAKESSIGRGFNRDRYSKGYSVVSRFK